MRTVSATPMTILLCRFPLPTYVVPRIAVPRRCVAFPPDATASRCFVFAGRLLYTPRHPPTPTEPSKLKLLFVRQTLYGFLRLRIPSGTSPVLPDLKGCALIRELHVYGKLKKVCRCVQVRDVWLSRLS